MEFTRRDLSEIVLSASDVAKLFGLTKRAVVYWCEHEQLKATRTTPETGDWRIAADSVLMFVADNPKRVRQLRSVGLSPYSAAIRDAILREIDALPKIYAIQDLEKIFDVTGDTVKYWIKMGWMPVKRRRGTIPLFDVKCLKEFVQNVPRYRKQFEKSVANGLV